MTYLKRGAASHEAVPDGSPVRIARSGGNLVEANIGPLPGIVHGQPHAGMEAM